MWGGGKWLVQNKVLPGFFHRFLSANKDGIPVSDRGNAAIGLELDWGADDQIVTVENADFQKNSKKIFGYSFTDEQMKPLREIFLNATTLYYYRLNGGGEKATSKWGTAKYTGTRGNDLKVAVVAAVDEPGKFDVETYLGTAKVDTQRAATLADLADNDFVVWNKDAGTLTADAGTVFSGGTNGTTSGDSHQAFLDKAERVAFHTLACNSNDKTTVALYVAYTKRMCDEVGKVFQLVVPGTDADAGAIAPDNYNVIVIQNKVLDEGAPEYALIYWALGAHAGVAVNKTLQNRIYNGEYKVDTDYTQTELENFINGGKFAFHEAGDKVRVLADINSFVTVTEEEQGEFKNNQSVRVFYQQITDISATFNKNWQGITPNDADGRSAFRGVVIKYLQTLQDIRAIQEFDPDTVVVEKGDAKGAVLLSYPTNAVNAMYQLYATITVQ
jgi:hypothetical protein